MAIPVTWQYLRRQSVDRASSTFDMIGGLGCLGEEELIIVLGQTPLERIDYLLVERLALAGSSVCHPLTIQHTLGQPLQGL